MPQVVIEILYPHRPAEGRRLGLGTYRIGREGGDINLADPQVSATHGELRVDTTGVTYRDLGSTNGSFLVDGRRIERTERLAEGDRVLLGHCTLVLQQVDVEPSKKASRSANPASRTMLGPSAAQIEADLLGRGDSRGDSERAMALPPPIYPVDPNEPQTPGAVTRPPRRVEMPPSNPPATPIAAIPVGEPAEPLNASRAQPAAMPAAKAPAAQPQSPGSAAGRPVAPTWSAPMGTAETLAAPAGGIGIDGPGAHRGYHPQDSTARDGTWPGPHDDKSRQPGQQGVGSPMQTPAATMFAGTDTTGTDTRQRDIAPCPPPAPRNPAAFSMADDPHNATTAPREQPVAEMFAQTAGPPPAAPSDEHWHREPSIVVAQEPIPQSSGFDNGPPVANFDYWPEDPVALPVALGSQDYMRLPFKEELRARLQDTYEQLRPHQKPLMRLVATIVLPCTLGMLFASFLPLIGGLAAFAIALAQGALLTFITLGIVAQYLLGVMYGEEITLHEARTAHQSQQGPWARSMLLGSLVSAIGWLFLVVPGLVLGWGVIGAYLIGGRRGLATNQRSITLFLSEPKRMTRALLIGALPALAVAICASLLSMVGSIGSALGMVLGGLALCALMPFNTLYLLRLYREVHDPQA